VFGYEQDGCLYNVCFECVEKTEPETGIRYADIVDVLVTDPLGLDGRNKVDMETVTALCRQKAVEALSRKIRPDLNAN
jgi:hypothetical protein